MPNPNPIESHGLNFHPMPKRFMVWDKGLNKFYTGSENKPYIFDIWSLLQFMNECQRFPQQLEIIQSTNLFDKDGKEIFEGSIVKWGVDTGLIELHNGKWTFHVVDSYFDVYHELCPNVDLVKVIGHILSNPELLEEK